MKTTVSVSLEPFKLEREFRVSHAVTSQVHLLHLVLTGPDGSAGSGEISADSAFDQNAELIAQEARDIVEQGFSESELSEVAEIEKALGSWRGRVSGPALLLAEMALLDRCARLRDESTWEVLRLPEPGKIQLLHTVPIGEDASVRQRPLKVKVGGAHDLEVIESLQGQAGPIMLDVNEGWDRDAWQKLSAAVQSLAPAVLEDPTKDETLLEEIKESLPSTSIVLDESIHDQRDIERALRIGVGANVKIMRMGGLFPAIQSLQRLRQNGRTSMLGSFLEPANAVAYAAQLNALADWTDLDGHFWISGDQPTMQYWLDSSRSGNPVIDYRKYEQHA
ncbi:enolase C-terminal domain-like protein [Psychromicrobium lacuslunae]|uniref:enolase C-terminal domain-like protein n=1 Tax=Psychromicrobium lacuslunae TaxID=1618207 RepID=UPI0012FEC299|nr:enolase C-terminal domain-like protein [Psychromicrobium lacuslunae]